MFYTETLQHFLSVFPIIQRAFHRFFFCFFRRRFLLIIGGYFHYGISLWTGCSKNKMAAQKPLNLLKSCRKIIGLVKNFKIAGEPSSSYPSEPIMFLKAPTTIIQGNIYSSFVFSFVFVFFFFLLILFLLLFLPFRLFSSYFSSFFISSFPLFFFFFPLLVFHS